MYTERQSILPVVASVILTNFLVLGLSLFFSGIDGTGRYFIYTLIFTGRASGWSMNLQAYWNKVYSVAERLEEAAELFPCVVLF